MSEQSNYSAPNSSINLQKNTTETYQPSFMSLDGRIGRMRWLAYGMGFNIIVSIISKLIATGNDLGTALSVFFLLVQVAFWIVLAIRRLNDLNKSGWLSLILFIPIVNVAFLLYLLFAPGTADENNYGLPPNENTAGLIVLATLIPVVALTGILAAIAIPAYQSYIEKVESAESTQ
ncbi:MAG: DUF805 domain-containing protein [Saccharospirillaceae bacterium]|nr:DUF805 domain-containing protein [Pseudomonadales bacterium]NRB78565.1 DUF805 domain-containing protein [Saccharospirillaceae bacterium]